MRYSELAKAIVIAFVVCTVIGEEAAINKEHVNFEDDVSTILKIIIHGSQLMNQEIFLREIISNASDALDKVRMMYSTDPRHPKNDAGEEPEMKIRISVDKDKRMIYVQDGGVGMTKDELKNNLGSLGATGSTLRFLEALNEGQDGNHQLVQYGFSFYSVFLVSERVKVASKSDASDKQWIWESTGDGSFYIYEDPRGNTLGRGTELMLKLKEDADQFLDNEKLKTIVHRYSEFIHFPILIKSTKIEKIKKEVEDDDYESVPVDSWDLINGNKPIWTRKTSDVNEAEYESFYKSLTKDYDAPMFYTHFSAEGEVEFKAILFVPGRTPYNLLDDPSITHSNIRLYVRRVFITDEFKDLLPRYLNFVKGVVDSDDLALPVRLQRLPESRVLKIIKKKLLRRALTMFSDIAASDKCIEEDTEENKKDDDDDNAPTNKQLKEVTFPKFWNEFGMNLRLGLIEDVTNRARLTKLLRYKSSKDEDKYTSLEDYVERMPDTQKSIYYMVGESIEKIKQQPILYDAQKKDVEVIYMVDAIDEEVVGHITEFSGKKLVNLATKTGVEDMTSSRRKKIRNLRAEKYEPLTKWFKDLLGDKVTKVIISTRMTEEPLVVFSPWTPKHGATANMMRLSQTLGEKQSETDAKRVLEINHLHPLVHEIWQRVQVLEEGARDEKAEDIGLVLYDIASLRNGFEVHDSLSMAKRVGRMLRQSVNISPDAPLREEDVSEYEVPLDYEEEGDRG